jgi:ribosomal-protein-alanine N-acetyltransferase
MPEGLFPARPEDCVRLAAIDAETNPSPWSADAFRESLARSRGLTVRDDSGTVLGFVVYTAVAGACEILELAVTVPARQRGLGRKLLDAAIEDAVSEGARRCILEVRESNTAARALYAGAGFLVDGRRKAYYRTAEGREDALLMSCDL